jgi:hypothetical protein
VAQRPISDWNSGNVANLIKTGKSDMSKSFSALLLLVILTSACSRPVSISTLPTGEIQSAQAAPSSTPTPLFNTTNPIPAETATPLIVTATVEAFCRAAPHVKIGQQVTVLVEDWDKLKLRSRPEISADTVLMELDQYSQLKILDGPTCIYSPETGDSHWFWKVTVIPGGEVGWVAEGDDSHYFIG